MTAKLIKWHKRLAWAAGIAFLLWAASGLLHPLMSWTNPRPASFAPPPQGEIRAPDILSILSQQGITRVSGLRLLDHGILQVTLPDTAERIYLRGGEIMPDADRARAITLARHYTGAKEAVRSAEIITEFDHGYPAINRYLPAWKITFDRKDGLSAYVETDTDRLGAITNTRKIILQTIFQTVHTWSFLDRAEGVRVGLILLLVGTALGMAGFGMALYLALRRPGGTKGKRKVHRLLALIAWIPLTVFPASGLFHLVMQSKLVYPHPAAASPSISAAAIPALPQGPQKNLRLVILPDRAALWHADGDDDRALALRLAAMFSDSDREATVGEIKKFSSEYGFTYKRLPVWRVAYDDGRVFFIEPRTATLAAATTPARTTETWFFSTFHKWQFLDPYTGKTLRDIIMIAVVLTGMAMALSGLGMIKSRKRFR
ncbi:MAG: hypothetical protein HYU57_05835 [Micavibrio aeruginosavorus]|nr:hypothetical protein [Micavibrio aeruginosavorus]